MLWAVWTSSVGPHTPKNLFFFFFFFLVFFGEGNVYISIDSQLELFYHINREEVERIANKERYRNRGSVRPPRNIIYSAPSSLLVSPSPTSPKSHREREREREEEGDGDERACDGRSGLRSARLLIFFKSPWRPCKHPSWLSVQGRGAISLIYLFFFLLYCLLRIPFDRTLLRKILLELVVIGVGVLRIETQLRFWQNSIAPISGISLLGLFWFLFNTILFGWYWGVESWDPGLMLAKFKLLPFGMPTEKAKKVTPF